MRAVRLLFTTALLVATAALAQCGAQRADRDAAALAHDCAETTPPTDCAEHRQALTRTRWGLTAGAISALLLCTAAWTRRGQTSMSVLLLLTTSIAVCLAPRYCLGPTSPGSARGLALAVAILAFIAIAALPEPAARSATRPPTRLRDSRAA